MVIIKNISKPILFIWYRERIKGWKDERMKEKDWKDEMIKNERMKGWMDNKIEGWKIIKMK